MNKRKATVQTNEKKKQARNWRKEEIELFARVIADPCADYINALEKRALKKEANAKVFESILADFQRGRERGRERERETERGREAERGRERERERGREGERELEDENFIYENERIFSIKRERLYLMNRWNYQWLLCS